jgi:mRNA interferase MazF
MEVFQTSERLAKKLKVSRSAVFAMGIKKLAEEYDDDYVTAKLNEFYSKEKAELDPVILKMAAGYRRPVIIIQADRFNRSEINTAVIAIITTNTRLENSLGNIRLTPNQSGLSKDSVVNVSQLYTMDKRFLLERVGTVSDKKMEQIDNGLRLVLSL